jgi:hypothetical protein
VERGISIAVRGAVAFGQRGLELSDLSECGWRESLLVGISRVRSSLRYRQGEQRRDRAGMPHGVRGVIRCAFEGCQKLCRVSFGLGAQIIECYSFERSESLFSLEFPGRAPRFESIPQVFVAFSMQPSPLA